MHQAEIPYETITVSLFAHAGAGSSRPAARGFAPHRLSIAPLFAFLSKNFGAKDGDNLKAQGLETQLCCRNEGMSQKRDLH